jgi:GT2 family glycosyltransferase
MTSRQSETVDIIFVCYNNGRDIERCFASLESCTDSYGQVIVVDNGSASDTLNELGRCGALLKKGRLLLHRNGKNEGYARALNSGIAHSRAPYLVFGNMDISFHDGWLPPLIAQLRREDVAFTGGKILDGRGRLNSCGIGGTERSRYHRGWGRRDRGQFDRVEDVVSVSGALFASKRSVFERLGGFDEHFFLYFEETEMHIRARRAGYRIVYTPHCRITHYLGKSPKPRGEAKRWFAESEAYFNRKLGFTDTS